MTQRKVHLSDQGVLLQVSAVVEKVKVGMHGQVVIPKRLRKKLGIEHGKVLEIEETREGLLLKPYNPISEMKGLRRGIFGDPIEYQRKLRKEWEPEALKDCCGH